MNRRPYNHETDREAIVRVWREVGWIDTDDDEKALDVYLQSGDRRVGTLDDVPECLVSTDEGTLHYLGDELTSCCVTGVTTSHLAKRRGLATRLVSDALADHAERGTAVAALGMFDQGFYDRVGFGTTSYAHWCTFDPQQLTVPICDRIPVRLNEDDWHRVHDNRCRRARCHGAITLLPPDLLRAEMLWTKNGFGYGFVDDDGCLTHHIWLRADNREGGPYVVEWMAFRTREEFLELLGLLKRFSDQVTAVRMSEPGHVQLQDLLRHPFRMRRVTRDGKDPHRMLSAAYLQVRILDLSACLSHLPFTGRPVTFRLELTDPIASILGSDRPWNGISGTYTIHLSTTPDLTVGAGKVGLPTLRASVGAFSRLWLGVRSATSLSWTDQLAAPPDLLARLDDLHLPRPTSDWDF